MQMNFWTRLHMAFVSLRALRSGEGALMRMLKPTCPRCFLWLYIVDCRKVVTLNAL